MAKPPMTAKLARVVRTRDSGELRTRGEAAAYMTAMPEQRARYQAWQHAARLLLDVADGEADIADRVRLDAGWASPISADAERGSA